MSLMVRMGSRDTTFTYNGEDSEFWLKAIMRFLESLPNNYDKCVAHVLLGDNRFFLVKAELNQLKQRIKTPNLYVEIERVFDKIVKGLWNEIEYLDFTHFVKGVRELWRMYSARPEAWLDVQILEALRSHDNCGLTVDIIIGRVFQEGFTVTFKQVRDSLNRLCRLYVAEHSHGQFSVRGILER